MVRIRHAYSRIHWWHKGPDLRDVRLAREALPPSSAAIPPFLGQQQQRPVLNGRPYNNSGPPIGFFQPVFKAPVRSSERLRGDAKTYFSVSLRPYLRPLIRDFFVVTSSVTSDGVILDQWGDSNAYLAMRRITNEIGAAQSDSYNQGSLDRCTVHHLTSHGSIFKSIVAEFIEYSNRAAVCQAIQQQELIVTSPSGILIDLRATSPSPVNLHSLCSSATVSACPGAPLT